MVAGQFRATAAAAQHAVGRQRTFALQQIAFVAGNDAARGCRTGCGAIGHRGTSATDCSAWGAMPPCCSPGCPAGGVASWSLCRHLLGRHHPAAAHCLVERDHGFVDHAVGLRIAELRVEQTAFRVQHLDITRIAALKTQPRKPRIGLQRIDLLAQHHQLLARLLQRNQRIVDFLKCGLDRLLILDQRLLLLRFGLLDLTADAAGRKNRHAHRTRERPDARRPGEQFRELATG